MFKENKSFIFKVFVIFIALFLLAKWSPVGRMHKDFGSTDGSNVITVSGKGEVQAKPDIASINFTINKEGKTVAEAQKAVAEIEAKVLAALKSSGVEDKDIKTDSSSFNPKYDYGQVYCVAYPCPQKNPKIIGYEAYESLTVKIRKVDDAGKIIEEVGKTGVQNLVGPNFEIDDEEGLKAIARKKAIEDAKAKAEVLAKDLGVKLGRISNFTESGNDYPIYYAKAGAFADSARVESANLALPQGENTINSSVSITYKIR